VVDDVTPGKRAWLAAVAAVALTAPSVAMASGALSIAASSKIAPGAKVSEDSAHDQTALGGNSVGQGCFNDVEYWRLPLTAGDQVEIDGKGTVGANGFLIAVFPPTTTDKNIARASSVAHGFPDMRPVKFTARSTGVFPVVAGPNCYNGTDGPFTFVVTLKHRR